VLIVAFGGSVTALIPLYTVGVFVAFTLSQVGMVVNWRKLRDRGWRWRAAMNGLGASATAIVAVVVGVAKFALGAWMVLVLIPILIAVMWGIHRHYRSVEDALTWEREGPLAAPSRAAGHRADRSAGWCRSRRSHSRDQITKTVTAVHVTDDASAAERMKDRWQELDLGEGMDLVILESPFRALVPPLLAYIDALASQDPERPVTVVLSEFVPRHPWDLPLAQPGRAASESEALLPSEHRRHRHPISRIEKRGESGRCAAGGTGGRVEQRQGLLCERLPAGVSSRSHEGPSEEDPGLQT
jgi:hypothetical protein